jgi:hypothetical protein
MVLTHVCAARGRFDRGRRRSPTQGGVRCPSALAIEATRGFVTPGMRLCLRFVTTKPTAPGSSAGAAQPQHRLQFPYFEEPADSEERRVAEHEP